MDPEIGIMTYLRAWRAMLIPAVATFIGVTWWLWPLDIALWLAAGAGLAVLIVATFFQMALSISD